MHNTVEHCVKISAYSDKNCRRRSILKTVDRQTERQNDRTTGTSTDNKGRLTLSAREPITAKSPGW